MAYQLKGKIKLIMDLQTFPSGFTKREVVVTTSEDRYPQDIKLDCLKEKTELLDNLNPGDPVVVHFDLRGREYNGRYFNDLTVWKIESGNSAKSEGAPTPDFPVDSDAPDDVTEYRFEDQEPF
jgi:single-strand DNA-binding protein